MIYLTCIEELQKLYFQGNISKHFAFSINLLIRISENLVGNDMFSLTQDQYYSFLQDDFFKFFYTHDNFTMENYSTRSNSSLYIVQMDNIFLGIDMVISTIDDMQSLMNEKPIFKNIYKYYPDYNTSDYLKEGNQDSSGCFLKKAIYFIFILWFF